MRTSRAQTKPPARKIKNLGRRPMKIRKVKALPSKMVTQGTVGNQQDDGN